MLSNQEAYLMNVQATYRYYCYHVHNFEKSEGLNWIPSKFHMFLCDEVQKFIEKESTFPAGEYLILNTPPQVGKLVADDTPVLTRNGWKKHGDLVVGDEVISPSGKFVKVINVLPKQFANRLVTLTNGEQIKVHENHEWVVYDRSVHKEMVRETKHIEKRVSYGSQEKKRGHRYNFMLPIVTPLDCEDKELTVDPYVLGVWLGDGSNTKGQICAAKVDRITLDEVRKHYPEGGEWVHKDTGVITTSYRGLCIDLHEYDMCYWDRRTEKHIPQEYLTASKRQRLELLAGLIDTDGSVDRKHNRITFTTADKELRFSFEELIATFGWRTTTCEVEPSLSSSGIQGRKPYWTVAFNPTEEIPCRIERKKLKTFSKQRRISICAVEPIPEEQGNCITVEGGVYCVGKKLVPTHNSSTITEVLPSWYKMRYPDKGVILISYGDDLAHRFGRANLEKIKQHGHIFGVEVNKKKATASEVELKGHKLQLISRGIGASLTGFTGNLILIDDPIKNREDADSEGKRNKIWAEFNDSIATRLNVGDKLILIMTRWHEDDLAGRIIKEYPERTTVINIPCEADSEDDPLGRKIGEPICPETGRDKAWVEDKKRTITTDEGIRTWNALYQGRPTAREGNMLKREWWEYYDYSDYESGEIKLDTLTMSVDATFKDKDKNDFVAIQVWGKKDNRCYLLESINEHLNFPDTLRKLKVTKARYPKVGAILIEDKANGSAIIQTLKEEIMGVIPVEPRGGKEARVEAISHVVEAGNVYIPRDKKFTWEFIDQCAEFPNGKHDDIVDCMSQCLARIIHQRTFRQTLHKVAKTGWEDVRRKPKRSTGKGERINVV